MKTKQFVLMALAFCLVSVFIFGVTTSKSQTPCKDCQYRAKTAACIKIDLSGAFNGTGDITVKLDSGGQIKCKSGTGSCTPELCD